MTQRKLNAGGFSLLETLVALAILSLSLGVIYQSQSHSVRAIGRGLSTQEALLRAETVLAEHTGAHAQQPADQLGTGGISGQQVQKWLLDLPPLAPGWPTVTMYQVNVLVSDSSRVGETGVRLTTLDSP